MKFLLIVTLVMLAGCQTTKSSKRLVDTPVAELEKMSDYQVCMKVIQYPLGNVWKEAVKREIQLNCADIIEQNSKLQSITVVEKRPASN